MTKKSLADELRKRQMELGMAPTELINRLTDDQIIDSYTTCRDCGHKEVPSEIKDWLIAKAQGVDSFFNLVEQVSSQLAHCNR